MTHDNVTDIVGRLLEMAPEHGRSIVCNDRTSREMNADIRLAADTIATLRKQLENARSEALEKAARLAYITCAETRHVTLGQKVETAIRVLKGQP